MKKRQLQQFLKNLSHRLPFQSFRVRQIAKHEFRVHLVLRPHTPITEELFLRLESSFSEMGITSLSVMRIEDHLEIRMTLRFADRPEDRLQEVPSEYGLYASARCEVLG